MASPQLAPKERNCLQSCSDRMTVSGIYNEAASLWLLDMAGYESKIQLQPIAVRLTFVSYITVKAVVKSVCSVNACI